MENVVGSAHGSGDSRLEHPEHPESPEHPGHPEHPERPEHSEPPHAA